MEGTLDPKKVEGKILACMRGKNARIDKGVQAALAGAVGMILCNDKASGDEIISDPHVLPATHITYTDGLAVYGYINSTAYSLSLSLSQIHYFFLNSQSIRTIICAVIQWRSLQSLCQKWIHILLHLWPLFPLRVQTQSLLGFLRFV